MRPETAMVPEAAARAPAGARTPDHLAAGRPAAGHPPAGSFAGAGAAGSAGRASARRASAAFGRNLAAPPGPLSAARVRLRAAEDEEVRLLRRRAQAGRRRRTRLWRRLRSLAAALLAAAATAAAVAWLLTSPRFALREIEVAAGGRVSEAWVRETLAPFAGRNLLRLPLPSVARRLAEHAWVAATDLRKELPGRLHVRVIERREAALLRAGDRLLYLDETGRPIAPLAGGGVDLVVVSLAAPGAEDSGAAGAGPHAGVQRAAAVALLREIEAARPGWLDGLSEIEVLGGEDFRVHAAGLPCPLLLRAGTVEERSRRLEELLPQIVERYGSPAAIDLRFARRIIVQPTGGDEPGPHRPATSPAGVS